LNNDSASRALAFYRSNALVPCVLLVLTVFVLAPGLFAPNGTVASSSQTGTDAVQYFGYVREWGFGEMRHGRLPLWNPYIFSGCPFLGGWQEGLLYPPNWIYLLLPLSLAMNCEIAIHVFLAGFGTALWVQRTGAHRLAGLLSGCMVMFGAPFFLHAYAGHLSMVDAMAMAPWLLLAIDGILKRPELRWVLLGAGALGFQLLAGHPQTVFITIVACSIYAVLRIIQSWVSLRALAAFVAVGIGALILSCAQLVAGFAAASEGARRGGLPYGFASMFSFPPENFMTMLVPNFFGDMTAQAPYWGRCYLWEASAFVGVIGLTLAIYGAARSTSREKWVWTAMVAIMLWIALAAHTPLFHLLYTYVPGFNRFRSHAKFVYPASLFLAMLAGQGTSAVLREPKRLRGVSIATAVAAVAFGAAGVLLTIGCFSEPWERFTSFVAATGEAYFNNASVRDFVRVSQVDAGQECLVCALILTVLTVALYAAVKRPRIAYAIVALGMIEVAYYAWSCVSSPDGTMDLTKTIMAPGEQRFLAAHPGDYRILQQVLPPDDAIGSSTGDIWGYDPSVMGRYAEFLFFTQGRDPNEASSYLNFTKASPLLGIVRCRYEFLSAGSGRIGIVKIAHPLPHVFVARDWSQASGRDAIFAKLGSPGFDPAQSAILESPPTPSPVQDAGAGTATVTDSASDTVAIQADVSQPSLLVITDPYSRYWRATGLPGSAQRSYAVMPCDYAIMAIPLSAGHHLLTMRYQPDGFAPALWLMGLGWVVYFGLWVWVAGSRPRPIAARPSARTELA
jgi:hypothetical protein